MFGPKAVAVKKLLAPPKLEFWGSELQLESATMRPASVVLAMLCFIMETYVCLLHMKIL